MRSKALARHGQPDALNADPASQPTSADLTSLPSLACPHWPALPGLPLGNDIAISMDGRGAGRGNVLIERLWHSVKHEEVPLRAYDSVGEARAPIGRYLEFCKRRRPHAGLDARTPDQAPFGHLPQIAPAWPSPPLAGRRSSRAMPFLQAAPPTAPHHDNQHTPH